jgi:uncharacterized membrane protein
MNPSALHLGFKDNAGVVVCYVALLFVYNIKENRVHKQNNHCLTF